MSRTNKSLTKEHVLNTRLFEDLKLKKEEETLQEGSGYFHIGLK